MAAWWRSLALASNSDMSSNLSSIVGGDDGGGSPAVVNTRRNSPAIIGPPFSESTSSPSMSPPRSRPGTPWHVHCPHGLAVHVPDHRVERVKVTAAMVTRIPSPGERPVDP